jgi:hypothetical protein
VGFFATDPVKSRVGQPDGKRIGDVDPAWQSRPVLLSVPNIETY